MRYAERKRSDRASVHVTVRLQKGILFRVAFILYNCQAIHNNFWSQNTSEISP